MSLNTSINVTPKAREKLIHYRYLFKPALQNYCKKLSRLDTKPLSLTRYNRPGRGYIKASVRWSEEEAALLRHFSTTLHISMSRIVNIILETISRFQFRGQTDQSQVYVKIRHEAGRYLSFLSCWRIGTPTSPKIWNAATD